LVVSVAEIFPQDFVIIQTEAETADCIAWNEHLSNSVTQIWNFETTLLLLSVLLVVHKRSFSSVCVFLFNYLQYIDDCIKTTCLSKGCATRASTVLGDTTCPPCS
jgi:hypothetical protein